MNDQTTNRTFICSVVFVDLVGYSKRSVSEQLAIKDRFTALLGDALKDIAVNDRIVLDTGDGAAMSFLGDPEDALFVGMSLRDTLKSAAPAQLPGVGATAPREPGSDSGGIRIGINLGPVKLVKDINGHPNIVGDGINVAQRIMSFAEPGQVLVSRSYYDVVSCLSDEYGKLFAYDGSRTDKHVREHEVYVVGDSESAFSRAKTGMERRAAGSGPKPAYKPEAGGAERPPNPFVAKLVQTATAFVQDRRKVMIAGGALAAVVLLLAGLLIARKPAAPRPPLAQAGSAVSAPAAPNEEAKAVHIADAAKSPAAPRAAAKADASKKEAPRPHAPPGVVNLAVIPWGEVYVNGKSRGVSPPMKSLKLAPGKYQIEIRNSNLTPYDETVEVKSREALTIRHTFK
jgi:class 3 adenylate cyclase